MTTTLGAVGVYRASERHQVVLPRSYVRGVTPVILAAHGRGGDATQFLDNNPSWWLGLHVNALVEAGYAVAIFDAGGTTAWSSDAAMTALTNALTWARATPSLGLGIDGLASGAAKVGLMGWSMGGCTVLEWMQRNASQVAATWCWTPCTDLPWARAQAAWTAEIDAAHGATALTVHSPIAHPAAFAGQYVSIVHAVDDAIIPVQQSRDFVAAVADSKVTLHEVPAGGHTNLFNYISSDEIIRFYAKAGLK